MKKKIGIYLSETEWQIVLHSLNDFRNKLIREKGYCPDVVNEVLAKVMNAQTIKLKSHSPFTHRPSVLF